MGWEGFSMGEIHANLCQVFIKNQSKLGLVQYKFQNWYWNQVRLNLQTSLFSWFTKTWPAAQLGVKDMIPSFHFIHLSFIYTRPSVLAQALPCMSPCVGSPESPHSSFLPLLCCLNTSAEMWELRQRWERTPTLHSRLKIEEKHRLELLQRRRRNDRRTMLKNGVSVMTEMPSYCFRKLNMDMLLRRGGNRGGSCSSGSPLWP